VEGRRRKKKEILEEIKKKNFPTFASVTYLPLHRGHFFIIISLLGVNFGP
jgi:hypothetical protein